MTNEEAIEELKAIKSEYSNKAFGDSRLMRSEIEALDMAIQALEKEPICPSAGIDCEDCPAYVPCGDAISRQAVLDAIEELKKIHFDRVVVLNKVRDRVLDLPSINPQEPKTGHRLYNDIYDHYLCGNCKTIVMDYDNFCPNCGARMAESEG